MSLSNLDGRLSLTVCHAWGVELRTRQAVRAQAGSRRDLCARVMEDGRSLHHLLSGLVGGVCAHQSPRNSLTGDQRPDAEELGSGEAISPVTADL